MIYKNSHQIFVLRDLISNLSDNSIFQFLAIFSPANEYFSLKLTFQYNL